MRIQGALQVVFGFYPAKPIMVEMSPARLTSDAGLLPIRQFDERIHLTRQFAAALKDLTGQAAADSISVLAKSVPL